LFCKDHTVKSGGPNMSQQTSELSVKWRAMSDEEKEVSKNIWRPPSIVVALRCADRIA
jgi:hypothetical protein